ncbi:MAG TPA: non-canonical purine NTP pyrophosphatase [Vicinamibacterales bacterium]|nr:non-canonical purine NTP pyrophosphatase [Vicinamibacterales bacterium]
MDLLIATSNPNKLREIRQVLADVPVALHSLAELPRIEEPEETGATFAENARLKADYYAAHVRGADGSWGADALTVAEDSGLVIDALNGEPGVLSARFIRPDASYEERFAEIERRLAEHPERPRTARFVCALAAVKGGRVIFDTRGVVEGTIASTPAGKRGFGYDPIFFFPPYARTLAEVDDAEKLAVAHRGHAFRALAAWLRNQLLVGGG